jgi:hypothetical protein
MKFALCGFLLLSLCGCADRAVRPSPTADQVMAEQYRAAGARGALSGSEATAIARSYRRSIGGGAQSPPGRGASAESAIDGNP